MVAVAVAEVVVAVVVVADLQPLVRPVVGAADAADRARRSIRLSPSFLVRPTQS